MYPDLLHVLQGLHQRKYPRCIPRWSQSSLAFHNELGVNVGGSKVDWRWTSSSKLSAQGSSAVVRMNHSCDSMPVYLCSRTEEEVNMNLRQERVGHLRKSQQKQGRAGRSPNAATSPRTRATTREVTVT